MRPRAERRGVALEVDGRGDPRVRANPDQPKCQDVPRGDV